MPPELPETSPKELTDATTGLELDHVPLVAGVVAGADMPAQIAEGQLIAAGTGLIVTNFVAKPASE